MPCKFCNGRTRIIFEDYNQTTRKCRACFQTFVIDRPQDPRPRRRNSYLCYNHQGKADILIDALSENWLLAEESNSNNILFALTDSDVDKRRPLIESLRHEGTGLFFVYPHAARPSLIHGYYEPWEYTTAHFVVNEYHAEVLRRLGYEKPIHSIGWHLCEIKEFTPKDKPYNVLFAPIHPVCAAIDRAVNADVFRRLYPYVKSGDINLTVRYIGKLPANGLEPMPGVTYLHGRKDLTLEQIDSADLVIAHQTFSWLAVARGVPTLMMGERVPAHVHLGGEAYKNIKGWDLVADLFIYPMDILEVDDTMALMTRAVQSDNEIRDWKRRMIGDPFDPDRFVNIIEGYIKT